MKKYKWIVLLICLLSTYAQATESYQYPFLCRTEDAGLGSPRVDNLIQLGMPVYNHHHEIIGYSARCEVPTQVGYFYKPKNQIRFLPLPKNENNQYIYPNDVDTINTHPYIVRIERGTLNRFMYVMIIAEDPIQRTTPQQSGYENKLLIDFEGGVGLGHTQASNAAVSIIQNPERLISAYDSIKQGYAIVFTTANATSTHYNLKLGLATAQQLKQHFIEQWGDPQWTLGFGSSGGAIQQYVYTQNDPTLLDGIFSLFVFPDLITQTTLALDCPLLEYYFDALAPDAPTPWAKRSDILGFPASERMKASALGLLNPLTAPIRHDGYGSDTCVNGWAPLAPIALNPYYGAVPGIEQIHEMAPVRWTLWANESTDWQYGTYPTRADGFTPDTFDNEGIQYGLLALRQGKISKQYFLDLNAKVGGWKTPENFVPQSNFPYNNDNTVSLWSEQNATASESNQKGVIAPRRVGDTAAIEAARQSGNLFQGNANKPMLDLRIDRDEEGDIHNIINSFKLRARLAKHNQDASHVLWILGNLSTQSIASSESEKVVALGMSSMEDWIKSNKAHPDKSAASNKPYYLEDGCAYRAPQYAMPQLQFGKHVWDGVLNPAEIAGDCTRHFTFYTNPRMAAGEDIIGDTLKCKLISVDEFIAGRGYGDIKMDPQEVEYLKRIFPTGVCHTLN